MSDGGKGSVPRPYSVDQATFASNWDRTFRGVAERSKASGSNPDYGMEPTKLPRIVGSNPTAPATSEDDD